MSLLLSVGVACTQLFGDRENTLAPPPAKPPTIAMPPLQPGMTGPMEVCTSGQMRCEGALLQTCADDRGSWVTVQRCAAAALCQVSPAQCLAATCSSDEMTCNGAVLQKCNAERTGWDLFDTCLSPAHCNADLRQCLPEPCTPGQRRCDRSDVDQAPVLEVCRDDRGDWGPLDVCVTRELCDQTLTSGVPGGGLVVGSDGMVQVQQPTTPDTVQTCNLPACAVGEVRCEGARLEFCSEGRTGWIIAEECASEALCTASLSNVSASGVPVCLVPVCAVGEHRCTETGMLQVCSEDRTAFRDQEQCIGGPFCNAVLADQGQAGCRDAPCEAGQMQCNGAQIQVCRADRTGLDDVGAPCESAALCNADDPANAFCQPPVCHRGATAGDEFHCEGAELQRCNESLTVYDTIQVCVTAALCDASQRFNGCKTPVCDPGDHACNGGFLQICNADQTGFDNIENCGSQAQCDANAGRCADPCEPGSTRCNQSNGDLEICRDPLIGWRPLADCPRPELCDQPNGRCDICLGGQFSCADNQLRECDPDGGSFTRTNIGPECAALPNNGVGVRVCQNNQVVVNPCPLGCTNGRCNECTGNQTQCVGNGQIRRCVNGFYGAPTSCSDGNACNGVETCQNNSCTGSPAPNCNDNNQCTSDSCSASGGCQSTPFSSPAQCINNGTQTQACNNGQLLVSNCTAGLGCTGGICNNCNQGACAGAQFRTCDNGQLSAPRNCPAGQTCQGGGNCVFNCAALNCNDNNPCTNDSCNAQQGCVRSNVANGSNCGDTNACNGTNTCQNGTCVATAAPVCNDGNACTTDSCNPTTGCQAAPVPNSAQCVNGAIQSCTNGNPGTQPCGAAGCNPGSTRCNACVADTAPTCLANGQRRTCAGGQFLDAFCPNGQTCQGGACGFNCAALNCNDGNPCTTDSCNAQTGCATSQPEAGCIACSGPFCLGNIVFDCVNGRGVQLANCDASGGICDPDQRRCSCTGPVCNGDTVILCDDGVQFVAECRRCIITEAGIGCDPG